ncbi:Gfo/Idh/MocA family protein [Halegenticoccus soli]|uniref:Gfo/Idh/MocA family protein n=1 Tax=Halegenticoccus soli TaxID=1985678 RepID=UPI000C6DB26B|nr:Gfo/Idh/MocA family oxidoreductase [Halegenticoccus soli]
MLNVAGVGVGALGRFELRLLSEMDGVDVVGAADPSPEAREAVTAELDVPAYENYRDLLDSEPVDAACVVTPHTRHYEQARECLDRGVHVHLEKPMVTDVDHAHDLIDRADSRELVLAVGYQRHLDPRFREIRRVVDEGRIGEPHMVSCFLEQAWIEVTRGRWRTDPALSGGGQLYDSGSHLLDSLLWTTRSVPVSVAATVDRLGNAVDVNSALAVTLEREGDGRGPGGGAKITASVGVSGDGQSTPEPGEGFQIWGTEGSVSFDGETIEVASDGITYTSTPEIPSFEALTRRKLANFVDAVRGEAELEISAEDGLRVTALTEAAYEAAERGVTVNVRELLTPT